MKKFRILMIIVAACATTVFTTSCGSMSDQDAFDIGYGAGTLIRNL